MGIRYFLRKGIINWIEGLIRRSGSYVKIYVPLDSYPVVEKKYVNLLMKMENANANLELLVARALGENPKALALTKKNFRKESDGHRVEGFGETAMLEIEKQIIRTIEEEYASRLSILENEWKYDNLTLLCPTDEQAEVLAEFDERGQQAVIGEQIVATSATIIKGHEADAKILDAEHAVHEKRKRKEAMMKDMADLNNQHFKLLAVDGLKRKARSEMRKDHKHTEVITKKLQKGIDGVLGIENGISDKPREEI